eukprot:scaffold33037_cov45-Phaeocystis_antarctica.AAC.1
MARECGRVWRICGPGRVSANVPAFALELCGVLESFRSLNFWRLARLLYTRTARRARASTSLFLPSRSRRAACG